MYYYYYYYYYIYLLHLLVWRVTAGFRSWGNFVGTATRLRVGFAASARHIPLLHKLQTGCGAHPTSYSVGTGWGGRETFSLGVRRPCRDADHLLVPRFRMAGAVYLLPPAFVACWGTTLWITSIIIPEKRDVGTCRLKFQAPLRMASNLRYIPVICLEGMRMTADILSVQPVFGLRFKPHAFWMRIRVANLSTFVFVR